MERFTNNNSPVVGLAACGALLKILGNILSNWTDLKYRRLNSTSKAVNDICASYGGFEVLLSIGFNPVGEHLVLADYVLPHTLQDARASVEIAGMMFRQKEEEEWLRRCEETIKRDGPAIGARECPVEPLNVNTLECGDFFKLPPIVLVRSRLAQARFLKEVLERVIDNPGEARYRRLKVMASRMAEFLSVAGGAHETLLAAQFARVSEPDGDVYCFPANGDIVKLRSFVRLLETLLTELGELQFAENSALLTSAKAVTLKPKESDRGPSSEEAKREWQRKNEELLTVSQLISDISSLMELVWIMQGSKGMVAHFRKEKKALMEKYKQDSDIHALYDLKEEWVSIFEEEKKKGGSIYSTLVMSREAELGAAGPAPSQ